MYAYVCVCTCLHMGKSILKNTKNYKRKKLDAIVYVCNIHIYFYILRHTYMGTVLLIFLFPSF